MKMLKNFYKVSMSLIVSSMIILGLGINTAYADEVSIGDSNIIKQISTLDKDNLEDGKYEVYAEMIKTDRESYSMSNNGINHIVGIEVINGEYYLTVQFKGLAIYNQFGYLMDLYYYDNGYTYNQYGNPEGTIIPAEVLSTYDVIDQYNDADHLYPQTLQIKLVEKASGEYVPLQVFVPIMEAIADGTGTQNVLMKIDWSTLIRTDSDIQLEPQEEQSSEFNYTDSLTGIQIHADKGILEENTSANIIELSNGVDYSNVANLINLSKYKLYDISLSSSINGIIQISIPVPNGYKNAVVYRIDDNKKTLVTGLIENDMFIFSTKEVGRYVIADQSATSDDTTTSTSLILSVTNPSTSEKSSIGYLIVSIIALATVIATKKRKE